MQKKVAKRNKTAGKRNPIVQSFMDNECPPNNIENSFRSSQMKSYDAPAMQSLNITTQSGLKVSPRQNQVYEEISKVNE